MNAPRMTITRSQKVQAALLLLGLFAWLAYANGLWYRIHFSSAALAVAGALAVVGSTLVLRGPEFVTLRTWTVRHQLARLLLWCACAVLLFGAALATFAAPVFFAPRETHLYSLLQWQPRGFRASASGRFLCSSPVIAKSATHMPGLRVTMCIDALPPPRASAGQVEVGLATLGYVTFFKSIRQVPA